jgi:hypothetical protein
VELIIMLLAPLPIGYFIRNRMAAYLAYVALHSFVFTFQSTTLLKEWNGGDYSAFARNPAAVDWSYGVVNLLIFAAGLGLVTLGSWLSAKRKARRPARDQPRQVTAVTRRSSTTRPHQETTAPPGAGFPPA